MAEIGLEAPFGRVTLGCATGTPGALSEPVPDLPEGMRIDGSRQGILHLAVTAGDRVEITISAALSSGAEARRVPGEMLAAWEVEAPDLCGAYGMPDAEWLEGRFGLRGTGFSESRTGVTLHLLAGRPVVAEIPLAAAWTLAPASEEERFAPFLAMGQIVGRGSP